MHEIHNKSLWVVQRKYKTYAIMLACGAESLQEIHDKSWWVVQKKCKKFKINSGHFVWLALLSSLCPPAAVSHLVVECSNACRSANVACHSEARTPDRQNKERIC